MSLCALCRCPHLSTFVHVVHETSMMVIFLNAAIVIFFSRPALPLIIFQWFCHTLTITIEWFIYRLYICIILMVCPEHRYDGHRWLLMQRIPKNTQRCWNWSWSLLSTQVYFIHFCPQEWQVLKWSTFLHLSNSCILLLVAL